MVSVNDLEGEVTLEFTFTDLEGQLTNGSGWWTVIGWYHSFGWLNLGPGYAGKVAR